MKLIKAADHTSSHPIRSTILAAIAVALVTIALVVVASGNNSALAASSVVNGNFETGDLTGWSVDTTNGGDASAVDRYVYADNPVCEYDCSRIIPPHEGSYFALLTSAGQPPQLTSISQPFEASNGDKVSGWAFFHTYRTFYDLSQGAGDETAQVVITNDSGTTVATPFEDRVSWQGNGGTSGWQYWEHTFSGLTGTGQFRIEARLRIPGPYYCWLGFETGCSVMGLDDVKTSIAGPDSWPPETYITSGPRDIETSTSATFEFYSNEQGSTFECQLSKDGVVVQAWANCTSPKSYSNLSRDTQWRTAYYFKVRATDLAGNVDPTPAGRYWYIEPSTDTQLPPPPTDATAPKVDSVIPKEDVTRVDRTTNVTATFSEDMMASSIDGTTFKLFKKDSTTKVAATVGYDPKTRTATLNPFGLTTTRLARGTTYKAVVTTGATDMAGNSLDENPTLDGLQQKTWFFTTTR
jgi:hypothetical protein